MVCTPSLCSVTMRNANSARSQLNTFVIVSCSAGKDQQSMHVVKESTGKRYHTVRGLCWCPCKPAAAVAVAVKVFRNSNCYITTS
jgi:hypothetical protein